MRSVVAVLAGAAVLVTLPAGGRPFTAAVLLWGAVTLVELTVVLAAAGHRPIVPAAAVGALGVGSGVLVADQASWERVPLLMALMLLVTFVLALVAPRKRQITIALAVTVLPAMVIGLGTSGVLVLRPASAGFRWTLGLLLVTAVPSALAAVADMAAERRAGVSRDTVRVVGAGAMGGALLFGLSPPFGLVSAVAMTAIGLAAGLGTGALSAALAVPPREGAARDRGSTGMLTLLSAPLVAAPVVAFLALVTQA